MKIKIISEFISRYKKMNIAVKASLWFAICSILQRGISVITMPIFTRIMPTGEFGIYNIFQTWYNIFLIIITLNVHSEIFNKGLIEHNEEKDEFTSNQAGLLIALTFFFSIIYFIFHRFINRLLDLSTFLVLVMIFEILGNSIIGLWSARKRFEYDYIKIVILTVITSVLNPIVGIIAVLCSEDKAQARIFSNALIPAFAALFLLFFIKRKGDFFNSFSWWKISVMRSLPLIPHYLSLVLLNQSDKLMIKHFINNEYAAIYSVAHSAGLLMTIINTSINGSFVPWSYNKLKKENGEGILKLSNSLFLLVLCVNIFLIWFAPEAIKLLAAPQYAEAIWCLVPIAASVFYFFVYTLFVDVEIFYGGNKYIAIASVIAALLNIFLNYIFIPVFGFIAAGYTTLISYFMTMVLHYFFMKKILKKNEFNKSLFDIKMIVILSLVLLFCCAIAILLYNKILIRYLVAFIFLIIMIIHKNKIIDIFMKMKKDE